MSAYPDLTYAKYIHMYKAMHELEHHPDATGTVINRRAVSSANLS